MKTFPKLLIAAGCAALGAFTPAHATLFQDVDAFGVYMKKTGNDGEKKVTGTFNILTGDGFASITIGSPYYSTSQTFTDIAGYDPSAYSITEATAFFYFRDDASDAEAEAVKVKFIKDSGDHDGGGGDGNDFVFYDSNLNNKSFTLFSDTVNASVLAAIQDGVLEYEIKADRGDFYFDFARLEVLTSPIIAPAPPGTRTPVPDAGSALGMLALGGLGLAISTRLKRRVAA